MEFFESHVSLKSGNPETQILLPKVPCSRVEAEEVPGWRQKKDSDTGSQQ